MLRVCIVNFRAVTLHPLTPLGKAPMFLWLADLMTNPLPKLDHPRQPLWQGYLLVGKLDVDNSQR